MNLSFKTEIKGTPTLFPEKIAYGLTIEAMKYQGGKAEIQKFLQRWTTRHDVEVTEIGKHLPKIHSIRTDEADRWKPHNDIHFYIDNRKKTMFQFAPVVKVKSIQKILIKWDEVSPRSNNKMVKVVIDNRRLTPEEIEHLAVNDGFTSAKEFFNFFNEDFLGKIIHWTNFKY